MKGKKTGGRTLGSENKSTIAIKKAFADLVENNLSNITEWLQRVAKDNPGKALELTHQFAQYTVPLLARQELTGANGKDLVVKPFVLELTNEAK